jgi:DNA modification methylase
MVRVLKPSGSIFVNLGDKYVADNRGSGGDRKRGQAKYAPRGAAGFPGRDLARQKSLMLLPERYRIAAVDELGLIARAVIVWAKPNGLPESATDRVRRSHEDWVHLTPGPRYFSAIDEIREPHVDTSAHAASRRKRTDARLDLAVGGRTSTANPLGKLPGSVWEIATQPLNVPADLEVDHFAAFPMEWPRRLISGWCPREVCTVCGEGRRPTVDREIGPDAQGRVGTLHGGDSARLAHRTERKMLDGLTIRTITGYACACPDATAPATPGVVLDPFGGTGTTALVAAMLGRRGISVDLSWNYQRRIATWRASDPKERARAAGLDPDAVSAIKPEGRRRDASGASGAAVHAGWRVRVAASVAAQAWAEVGADGGDGSVASAAVGGAVHR